MWKTHSRLILDWYPRLNSTRRHKPTSPEAKLFAASMDIVERVLSLAQAIHSQFEQVKCCKHQCQRLVERIQILLEPVRILRAQPPKHISCHEEELLKKLLRVLGEAQKLVMKYSQTSWIQKFLRAHSTSEEFIWVNESLEDIAQGLSLLLQAEQKQAFLEAFQAKTCRRQDAEDLRDDRAFLSQVIASKCACSKPFFLATGGWHLPPSCCPALVSWPWPNRAKETLKPQEKPATPVLHVQPAAPPLHISLPRY